MYRASSLDVNMTRKDSVQLHSQDDVQDISKLNEKQLQQIKKQIRNDVEEEFKTRLDKQEQKSLNEQMKARENRSKNLKVIFSFYAGLQDVLDEQELKEFSKKEKNNQKSLGLAARQQQHKQNQANLKMGANKFFKFCHDFDLIGDQLDIKTLYVLFNRVADEQNVSDIRLQQIKYSQFMILIDKMASVYYNQSDSLYTQIDKTEQFARLLGLDDPKLFKHKLKTEGLVHFSFVFHDKYQLFSAGPYKDKIYTEALKKTNEIKRDSSKSNFDEDKDSMKEFKEGTDLKKQELKISKQLSKFINHQENKQVWKLDNSTMDTKHLYSDKCMTENDVFSEVALLSHIKPKKNTQHNSSGIAKIQNPEYIEEINFQSKSNNQNLSQSTSLNSLLKPSLHNIKIVQSPENKDNKDNNNFSNNNIDKKNRMQYSSVFENGNSSQIFKQTPLQSLLEQISPKRSQNKEQSFQMKSQVLNRAKEIANIEKARDSQRMNSLGGNGGISSQSIEIPWNIQSDQSISSFYLKSPSQKVISKQEILPILPLSEQNRQLHRPYKSKVVN